MPTCNTEELAAKDPQRTTEDHEPAVKPRTTRSGKFSRFLFSSLLLLSSGGARDSPGSVQGKQNHQGEKDRHSSPTPFSLRGQPYTSSWEGEEIVIFSEDWRV